MKLYHKVYHKKIVLTPPKAKAILVETVGVEPTSRDIATQASTCVVDLFRIRKHICQSTGVRVASLIRLF